MKTMFFQRQGVVLSEAEFSSDNKKKEDGD